MKIITLLLLFIVYLYDISLAQSITLKYETNNGSVGNPFFPVDLSVTIYGMDSSSSITIAGFDYYSENQYVGNTPNNCYPLSGNCTFTIPAALFGVSLKSPITIQPNYGNTNPFNVYYKSYFDDSSVPKQNAKNFTNLLIEYGTNSCSYTTLVPIVANTTIYNQLISYVLYNQNTGISPYQVYNSNGGVTNLMFSSVMYYGQYEFRDSLVFASKRSPNQTYSCTSRQGFLFTNAQTFTPISIPNEPYILLESTSSFFIGSLLNINLYTSSQPFNPFFRTATRFYSPILLQPGSADTVTLKVDSVTTTLAITKPTIFQSPAIPAFSPTTPYSMPIPMISEYNQDSISLSLEIIFNENDLLNLAEIQVWSGGLMLYSTNDVKRSSVFNAIVEVPISLISNGHTILTTKLIATNGYIDNHDTDQYLTPSREGLLPNWAVDIPGSNLIVNLTSLPFLSRPYVTVSQSLESLPYPNFQRNTFNFPYGFTGTLQVGTSSILIPILENTPNTRLTFKSDPYPTTKSGVTFSSQSNFKPNEIDLANPIVKVNIQAPSAYTPNYVFVVDVTDQIGINETSCFIKFGPYKYFMNANTRVSGDPKSGRYAISTDYSLAYQCNSPILVECYDLRQNRLSFSTDLMCGSVPCNTFTNIVSPLNYCSALTDPLYFTRLSYFGYSYFDSQSLNFSAIVSGLDNTILFTGSATLYFYEDVANTIPYSLLPNSVALQVSATYNSSIVFSTSNSIKLPQLSKSKTIYFGIKYSISNNGPFITLKSKDIMFFAKQPIQAYENHKIIIRNLGYTPLPAVRLEVSQTQDGKLLLMGYGNFGTLRNMTIIYANNYNPFPITFVPTFDTIDPDRAIVNIGTTPDYGNYIVYVSSLCDQYDNCQQFSKYTYYSTRMNQSYTQTTNKIDNAIIIVSNSNIYNLDNGTTFTLQFTTQGPLTFYPGWARLYIVEDDSSESFEVELPSLTLSSGTYSSVGSFKLPYGWGTRNAKISVWGLVDNNGYVLGTLDVARRVLAIPKYKAQVLSTTLDMQTRSIKVSGRGLGSSTFVFNNNQIPPVFVDQNTIVLPIVSNFNINSFNYVVIDGTTYQLDVLYCHFNCSGNGVCLDNSCSCNSGWSGFDCSINSNFTCKNNCSNQGRCVDQLCQCNSGFSGAFCEVDTKDMRMNMTLVEGNGMTTFGNFDISLVNSSKKLSEESKSISYNISIHRISEINSDGVAIKNFTMKWDLVNSSENSTHYKLNADQQPTANTLIAVKIDKYMQGGSAEWANQTMNFPTATVKYTVNITNYAFSGPFNYLEVVFETVSYGECTIAQDEKISWGAASLDDMHYFVVPQHQMQMLGRFPNSLVVDGRVISTSNRIISKSEPVQIATRIPNFESIALIDPDFSLLVDYQQENENDGGCGATSDKRKPYVIPLIVVGCVIAATIIGVALFVALKKNMFIREKISKIKSIKMKNRT